MISVPQDNTVVDKLRRSRDAAAPGTAVWNYFDLRMRLAQELQPTADERAMQQAVRGRIGLSRSAVDQSLTRHVRHDPQESWQMRGDYRSA